MAIQRLRSYSFEHNYITIGGYRFQEWGSDTGIEYTNDAPLLEKEVGATGTLSASKIENKHMSATLTVIQNGADYRHIAGLIRAQELSIGFPILIFGHVDLINGDEIVSPYTLFENRGDVSYGKVAGTVTYDICLPYAAQGAIRGALIL